MGNNALFRDCMAALYRGMESKLIQTVLTSAFMFAIYEHIVSVVSGSWRITSVGQ